MNTPDYSDAGVCERGNIVPFGNTGFSVQVCDQFITFAVSDHQDPTGLGREHNYWRAVRFARKFADAYGRWPNGEASRAAKTIGGVL